MTKTLLRASQEPVESSTIIAPDPKVQRNWTTVPPATPWRAMLIIVTSIFIGEMIVMAALTWADATRPIFGLIDALLVAIFTFALLRHFVLGPMAQSHEHLRAEIAAHNLTADDLRLQTAALQAAAHGVMITDSTGSIVWVNPAFVALTGYTLAEVFGQTPSVLNSGKHDAAFYDDLWQTTLAGNVWRAEIVNRRKDGTLYSEEQTITPVHDDAGHVTHFIAIMADCSERKLAEVELEQRNQQLSKLTQEEHRQRQLAEALAMAARSLNESLVLEEVLDRILEQTQSIIPCRTVVVMMLRGDWVDIARHRDATGAANAMTQGFHIDQFPVLRTMAALHRARVVMDTETDPGWTAIPGEEWIRSIGIAPLIEANRVTGFLAVVSEQAEYFDQEAVDWLVAFAAQAALALQNSRLYHAEQYARRTAQTLSAASVELTRSLHLPDVLDSLLRHLCQLVAYDGAHIALLTNPSHLNIKAAAGNDPWPASDPNEPSVTIDIAECPVLQALLHEQQSLILSEQQSVNGSPYFAALAPAKSWLGIPIVVGGRTLGLCGLEKGESGFFTAEHMRLAETVVAQASVAIQNAALFQQVQSSGDQLQLLSRHLVQVQENERKAVARELHDQAGQVLTSLKIGLRQLEREVSRAPGLETSIGELYNATDLVLDDLHRLAMDLRPAALDHLGLVVAISDHVANFNQQNQPHAQLEAIGFGDQERLPADVETALYRIVQEALNNVVRYAAASRVDLLLYLYLDKVRLTIEDDGVGFDVESATGPGHLGLLGMRERCEMLDGKFEVESMLGQGTTLVAELPLDRG